VTPEELRPLDAEVHRKVMGRDIPYTVPYICDADGRPLLLDVPAYSADIAAAWLVVEKLYETGIRLDLYRMTGHRTDWCCWFDRHGGYGDTAPLAVCRAALVAVSEHANHPP
jgi:hypothetical protein